MPISYLCTRPETVVSVVESGRLPDALPDYVKRELQLFKTIEDAIQSSTTKATQTFILELDHPNISDTPFVVGTYHSEYSNKIDLSSVQIPLEWIRKFYVANKTASNLIYKLFNGTFPRSLEIRSELFDQVKTEKATPFDYFEPTIFPTITVVKAGDVLGSQMQTLVNTVNCVGVMGKGVAFGFKQRYPDMFEDYRQRCNRREVQLGKPYLYKVNEKRWIVNFPTKDHWRSSSSLSIIEDGLKYLVKYIPIWGVTSIAFPALGCNNGGLIFDNVRVLIKEYLQPLNIPIEIYTPFAKWQNQKCQLDTNKTAPYGRASKRTRLATTPITFFYQKNPSQQYNTTYLSEHEDGSLQKKRSVDNETSEPQSKGECCNPEIGGMLHDIR